MLHFPKAAFKKKKKVSEELKLIIFSAESRHSNHPDKTAGRKIAKTHANSASEKGNTGYNKPKRQRNRTDTGNWSRTY